MFHLLGRKIAYIKNLLGKEKLYIPDILSLKKKKKIDQKVSNICTESQISPIFKN